MEYADVAKLISVRHVVHSCVGSTLKYEAGVLADTMYYITRILI